jgi:hypothetical protein
MLLSLVHHIYSRLRATCPSGSFKNCSKLAWRLATYSILLAHWWMTEFEIMLFCLVSADKNGKIEQ